MASSLIGNRLNIGCGMLARMSSETFSQLLISRARLKAGLTQRELAERAATSQAAISAYESGRRSPTVETLLRIVGAAGYEVRMRLDDPDTHVPALRRAEAHYPPEQLAAFNARQDARLAAQTGSEASPSRKRSTS